MKKINLVKKKSRCDSTQVRKCMFDSEKKENEKTRRYKERRFSFNWKKTRLSPEHRFGKTHNHDHYVTGLELSKSPRRYPGERKGERSNSRFYNPHGRRSHVIACLTDSSMKIIV